MGTEGLDLTLIWAMLIATAVFLYVVMDGFDLGIGILFTVIRDRGDRDVAVNTVAPVWDGNETWLVLGGGGLLAVFPLAYAVILPALYIPLILMLLALVFRGVAFEMRFKAETDAAQIWWDRGFWWGSTVAAFCQGITVGAFVQGIKVQGRAYAGGWWDWLTPFSLMTGVALVFSYGLLGACWLVWKTEGELPVLVVVLAWRFYVALNDSEDRALQGVRAEGQDLAPRDGLPFLCALGLFLLSYVGLGISMWPMIIPPAVTIWDAAAPRASQAFLLAGAVVLIPIILAYTGYAYWLFRGKVRGGEGYH